MEGPAPTPGQVILYRVMDPTVLRWALFACQRRLRIQSSQKREVRAIPENGDATQGSAATAPNGGIEPDLLVRVFFSKSRFPVLICDVANFKDSYSLK